MTDILATIEDKISAALAPRSVRVEDESHLHAGHGGAAEHAAEFGAVQPSHIHIAVEAERFRDMSRLARHRAVMDAVADEVTRLHAIRMTLTVAADTGR